MNSKQGSNIKPDSIIRQGIANNEGSGIRHSNFDKYFNQEGESEKDSINQNSKPTQKCKTRPKKYGLPEPRDTSKTPESLRLITGNNRPVRAVKIKV